VFSGFMASAAVLTDIQRTQSKEPFLMANPNVLAVSLYNTHQEVVFPFLQSLGFQISSRSYNGVTYLLTIPFVVFGSSI
jgi:hypothetical protein